MNEEEVATVVRAVERTSMHAEVWSKASEASAPDRGLLHDGRTLATITSGLC